MNDLIYEWMQAMRIPHGSEEFQKMVLHCVLRGSRVRSPFWHASTSLTASHQWLAKARSSGSQPSEGKRVAIRIDIWAWYQSGEMLEDGLIDLSYTTAQKHIRQLS